MATHNLRRFARADGLSAIAREHLLALLEPHKFYFDGRVLTVPPVTVAVGIPAETLRHWSDIRRALTAPF